VSALIAASGPHAARDLADAVHLLCSIHGHHPGLIEVALSLCPKVGAVISAVPPGVLGGATIVLYGLVGILGIRIWMTNHVDFSEPINQMTAAIPLIIGIADFTWQAGSLTFTGIALGSIAALVIYHAMKLLGFRTNREPSGDEEP
jgi:xanthine/uracil permease